MQHPDTPTPPKPWAIDLCCGLGGWTRGLLAAGFIVTGVDIKHFPTYPSHQLTADVTKLDGTTLRGCRLIVASPPCAEFSNANPTTRTPGHRPDLSIIHACYRIAREAQAPLVLENVHGAQRWLGPATHHYGKQYLWGDGVPPLLPQGPRWKDKGKTRHRSPALRSLIPFDLAYAVANYHNPSPDTARSPLQTASPAGNHRQE